MIAHLRAACSIALAVCVCTLTAGVSIAQHPFFLNASQYASPAQQALLAQQETSQASHTHSTPRELWVSPIGSVLRVDVGFSLPDGPYRAGHRGIDIAAPSGIGVRAPAAGEVTFAGMVVDRPVLSLRVDEHTVVSVEPVESDLTVGDLVSRGQLLGELVSGGHCAAHCLHLGVRVDGVYTNPVRFFRPRPELLPW